MKVEKFNEVKMKVLSDRQTKPGLKRHKFLDFQNLLWKNGSKVHDRHASEQNC